MSLVILLVGIMLAAVIVLRQSMHKVPEDRRLIVVRLGKFLRVEGPGLCWILPGLDTGIVVDPAKISPDWQQLPAEELAKAIENEYLSNPNFV